MKRSIILFPIIALVAICMFQACKKGDLYHSKVATLSIPSITLNGPLDTTINNGASWSDPGAAWSDSVTGESGTVYAVTLNPATQIYNVPASINTSVDSAYLLVYIAYNKNGFPSQILTRGLGVTNASNSVNLTGPYADSNGGRDSLYKVSRALFYSTNIDLQGNAGVICVKSNSSISVSTIFTADLTGAIIPETFNQSTISYTAPVTFGYTPNVLNVPPGSYSGIGIPMGLPVTFTLATTIAGGGVIDSTRTKF